MTTTAARVETRECEFPFTLERSESDGDGLTFEGYAAVFNSPTQIRDQDGAYTEVVAPGAFKKSVRERTPILMFDHGKHPMIGNIPIGKITDIREDPRGLYVRARLIDNPTINIVRDAIRAEAITGMSFRFEVTKDDWSTPARGKQRTRTLREVKVPEVGPVVFPAYADTTASVRSAVRALEEKFPDIMRVELIDQRDMDDCCSVSDMVCDAVEALWGIAEPDDVFLIDLFDDVAMFTVTGNANSDRPGLWQVNYTHADGQVTIAEPSRPPIAGYDQGTQSMVVGTDPPGLNSKDESGEERASDDDLPDSAFAYIEPGGTKDASGRTVPRSLRHFPIQDAAHVRNALARMSQSPFGDKAKPAIMAAAKKFGVQMADQMNSEEQSTSHEAAVDGTSEEAAVRAVTPKSKEQVIREIQLRERGITLPKGA